MTSFLRHILFDNASLSKSSSSLKKYAIETFLVAPYLLSSQRVIDIPFNVSFVPTVLPLHLFLVLPFIAKKKLLKIRGVKRKK